MKVFVVEAPSDPTKPALKVVAESAEDETSLWLLSMLGPTRYRLITNADSGDAKVKQIVFEDTGAS